MRRQSFISTVVKRWITPCKELKMVFETWWSTTSFSWDNDIGFISVHVWLHLAPWSKITWCKIWRPRRSFMQKEWPMTQDMVLYGFKTGKTDAAMCGVTLSYMNLMEWRACFSCKWMITLFFKGCTSFTCHKNWLKYMRPLIFSEKKRNNDDKML